MSNRRNNRAIVGFGSQATAGSSHGSRQVEVDEEESEQISGETDMLINTAVRYVLMQDHQHKPVQRIDIQKFLTEHHTVPKKTLALILSQLKKRLEENFGFRMVEVQTNTYIVHNLFTLGEIYLDKADEIRSTYFGDNDILDDATMMQARRRSDASTEDSDDDEEVNAEDVILPEDFTHDEVLDYSKRALVMIVLSMIYMYEFALPEAELFDMIKEFGLAEEYETQSCHDATSKQTVRKLIQDEFVRRHYLKRTKVTNQDPTVEPYFQYEWGFRSIVEFKESDILAFVKDIYNQPDSSIWVRFDRRAAEGDLKREQLINGKVKPNTSTQANGESNEDAIEQRPRKGRQAAEDDEMEVDPAPERTRGRNKGRQTRAQPKREEDDEEEEEEPVRRSRGRPRNDASTANARTPKRRARQMEESDDEEEEQPQQVTRRGRNRN